MKFKYNAKNRNGDLQTGFVEASTLEAATNILLGHELYILSLEQTRSPRWYDKILDFFRRVKLKDLVIFTRQFATLLEAKISLGDSLKTLYKQTRNQVLREAIFEISSDVDSGLSLSQALERQNNIFSGFYVSMVRSSEITGRMEESVGFMADYLEKEQNLISKIGNSLIYPGIIIVLLAGAVAVVVGFVFPQLEPIFKETNAELPVVTIIVLAVGNFFQQWWWGILLFLGVTIFVLFDYFRSEEGRVVFDETVMYMPIFGDLFKKIYVARFAEAASVLMRGGVPVAQALEIAGHTIGSFIYRDAIHEIAESVREGQLFSQALEAHEQFFPPLVAQMVAVGESTGKLDSLLSRTSLFFTKEIDMKLNNLVELIQPALIVVVAVGIGILFASVLLPMYGVLQAF